MAIKHFSYGNNDIITLNPHLAWHLDDCKVLLQDVGADYGFVDWMVIPAYRPLIGDRYRVLLNGMYSSKAANGDEMHVYIGHKVPANFTGINHDAAAAQRQWVDRYADEHGIHADDFTLTDSMLRELDPYVIETVRPEIDRLPFMYQFILLRRGSNGALLVYNGRHTLEFETPSFAQHFKLSVIESFIRKLNVVDYP